MWKFGLTLLFFFSAVSLAAPNIGALNSSHPNLALSAFPPGTLSTCRPPIGGCGATVFASEIYDDFADKTNWTEVGGNGDSIYINSGTIEYGSASQQDWNTDAYNDGTLSANCQWHQIQLITTSPAAGHELYQILHYGGDNSEIGTAVSGGYQSLCRLYDGIDADDNITNLVGTVLCPPPISSGYIGVATWGPRTNKTVAMWIKQTPGPFFGSPSTWGTPDAEWSGLVWSQAKDDARGVAHLVFQNSASGATQAYDKVEAGVWEGN